MTNCWSNRARTSRAERCCSPPHISLPHSLVFSSTPRHSSSFHCEQYKKRKGTAHKPERASAFERRSIHFWTFSLVNEEHHMGCSIVSSRWTDWGITSGKEKKNGYGHDHAETTVIDYISNRYVCRVSFFPATLTVLCCVVLHRRGVLVFISASPFNLALARWEFGRGWGGGLD